MSEIRTRFAPSPTGHLHVGGARTALFNWLLARAQGGKFVLRIEDTDAERSKPEFTEAILEAMDWLGLNYDEGPFFQSERKDLHLGYINQLLDEGKAYWCHCTAQELVARREEAKAAGQKPKYDGRCRDKNLGPGPGAVVRFKGPLDGATGFNDLIKGPLSFSNTELDDLVILRSDGMPTYNLAVVVDDMTMGITHVIRGDDHVNNTPRQILLYQAIGAQPPRFAHMPLTLGKDKTRLSKRHGATSVVAYRQMGYLPEALVNYFVRLGWSFGDEEIFSLDDLVKKFSLENVGKSPGTFDLDKLDWLNAHWIKEGDPARLAAIITPGLAEKGHDTSDQAYLAQAVETLQTRARDMNQLAESAEFYLAREIEYDEAAAKKFLKGSLAPVMAELIEHLGGLETLDEANAEAVFTALITAHEMKLGKIAQPVRVALTGGSVSPGIYEIMRVLGKERVLPRLEKALDFMRARAAAAEA